MNQRAAGICIAALLAATSATATAAKGLPIYIEDNHAGTFYWLAQNIDLDHSYTLILFDAHSDASGIFDSDKIRDALRNVASAQDRQTLLDRWRSKGAVQCFNWIEPLIPAPIEKVIGVPAEKLSASQIRERREEATAFLDGHLEAAPRKSGSLQEAYIVSDFKRLEKQLDPNRALIVTIDLDYFAGLPAAQQEKAFARIWNFVIERPTGVLSVLGTFVSMQNARMLHYLLAKHGIPFIEPVQFPQLPLYLAERGAPAEMRRYIP